LNVKKFCLACLLFSAAAIAFFSAQHPASLSTVHAQAAAAVTDWAAGATPSWIWGADNDKKYKLTTKFNGPTKAARLRASCDNVVTIMLNGEKVAESSEWQSPVEVDIQKYIKDGANELVLEVANQGGAAGCLCKVALTRADGKLDYVVTDETWQAASAKDKSSVAARVIAKHGAGPWGNVLTAKPAAAPVAAAEPAKFNLLPGFEVEKLYTVPKNELGSWVCVTTDDKGRLIVSDQGDKGLCRITPPPIGSKDEAKVERLDVKMSGAQGMLYAFGSLYCSVNGGPGSGLYRLRDTNNDDQYDEVTKLKTFAGGGEHGPHSLRLSPDGKSIYVICGNHTKPPFEPIANAPQTMGGIRAEQRTATLPENSASRITPNWDEDLVLPRQWDGGGHATGILAPGGWIAKTDPDAKTWEVVSMGYRNPYDMAFNADGELFAYDADMEWDFGAPWYRPTRVVHAVSGSEFGWRSGTGKWPTYYADSLPPVIDIGPGSPVGVEFGYGTKFPAKYQKALYICDWTFGTMYAIHLEPKGSTYTATKEEFVSRTPLPLTDCTVGKDGALYFTIGGRGTQSELFRVIYTGKESTEPVSAKDSTNKSDRAKRQFIEEGHVALTGAEPHKSKYTTLVQELSNDDRNIRYAARVALERLPTGGWVDTVCTHSDARVVINGVLGLARVGAVDLKPKLLAALDKVDYTKLSPEQRLEYLRALQLVCIRLGLPDDSIRTTFNNKLEAIFPASSDDENRELVNVLVAMKSPNIVAKTIPLLSVDSKTKSALQASEELLARNKGYGGKIAETLAKLPDAQQMHYVFALRNSKEGWTPESRKIYFEWFVKARGWSGGNSFGKFLTNIEKEAFNNATPEEQKRIDDLGLRKPFVATNLPKAKGPGKDYTLDDLIKLEPKLTARNFKNGSQMFQAARCVICHRFGGDGGSTGPDLTQLAGRFTLKDLSEAIVDPSKVVSDQYKAMIVETASGKTHVGRIVGDDGKTIKIATDPEDGTKIVEVAKKDIESEKPSPTSLMPKDLLKTLNQNEVLDLLAYLLSRGDPNHAMFKK